MTDQGGAAGSESDGKGTRSSMQVTIDGETRQVSLDGLTNFGELMERIERELVPPGRVVTELILNEEPLSLEQEDLLYGFALEHVGSLLLETAEPRSLAIDSLLHAQDYLPSLSGALEASASMIRRGELEGGLEGLDSSLELLQHFLAMLDGVRTVLQLDFAGILLAPDEGGSIATLQHRLEEQVQALLDTAEQEDWTAAAEIATYELSPLAYQFIAAMPLLIEAALRGVPEYRAQVAQRARKDPADLDWDGDDEAMEPLTEAETDEALQDLLMGDAPITDHAVGRTEVIDDALEADWEDRRPKKKPGSGLN